MSEMREILFRGKRKDNGKWVEGYYARKGVDKDTFKHFICVMTFNVNGNTYSSMFYLTDIEVIPETVGQYTGLTDKNGLTKVFDGDIIHGNLGNFVVRWSDNISGFVAGEKERTHPCMNRGTMKCYEVIGNIYDNPELTKEAEKI